MGTTLIILNDPPYGTERNYNGIRLACSIARQEEQKLKLFFFGDAVGCAKNQQKTLDGYYNIEQMLKGVIENGGEVGVCGACIDARGISESNLIEGTHRSTMDELTSWTLDASRVLVF